MSQPSSGQQTSMLLAGGQKRPATSSAPAGGGGGGGGAPIAASIDPMRLLRQYYWVLIGAAIIGVVFGTGLFFVLEKTMPRYSARVQFQVLPPPEDAGDLTDTKGAGAGGRDEIERFIQTQAYIMQQDIVLGKAVDDRQVKDTPWAQQFRAPSGEYNPDEALRELRKIARARVLPETQLIQLSLSTPWRESSKIIADVIAQVYLDDERQRTNKSTQDLIDLFTARIRDLSKNIQAKNSQMDTLLQEKQLTGLSIQESSYYNQVLNLQPQIVQLRTANSNDKEQLASYERLLNAPGGTIVPEAIRTEVERSPIVSQQDGTIATAKAQIRALKEEMSDNHPDMKRLQNQIEALEQERTSTLETKSQELFKSVIENVRNAIRNQEAALTDLESKLETAKSKLGEVTQALQQHEVAKGERDAMIVEKDALTAELTRLQLIIQRPGRVRGSPAEAPKKLAFPQPLQIIPFSTIAIVGLAGGLVVLRELKEQRIRGPHDIAITRTKVLGMIPDLALDLSNPKTVETACLECPQGAIAEAIRQVRSAVLAYSGDERHKSILFTAGLPEAGTTGVVANLAASAAATDLRVLVIDANVRRPALHKHYGVSEGPGLGDILLGASTLEQCIQATKVENVWLLSAGQKDQRVQERFIMPVTHRVIEEAKSRFDLVLIDSAPAVVGSDAMSLARHCDAVVLVVRAFVETKGLVIRLRNQINEARTDFLGVIVNGVKPSAGGYFKRNYATTHAYTNGTKATTDDKPAKEKRKKKAKEEEPAAAA